MVKHIGNRIGVMYFGQMVNPPSLKESHHGEMPGTFSVHSFFVYSIPSKSPFLDNRLGIAFSRIFRYNRGNLQKKRGMCT